MRFCRTVHLVLGFILLPLAVHGQRVAKYGADFLASGAGAHALGMGGAFVALASDVTAGYWNPAGLVGLDRAEVGYMHAERFAGVVSFDYAGVALPLSKRSTLALSLFRSGVNDIKNTLEAWDPERGLPLPDAEERITTFSAADYALFLSLGRKVNARLSWGLSGKLVYRRLGSFASAWGYSFDGALAYRTGNWRLGLVLQDATTMLQSWSINREALQPLDAVFGIALPEGGTELVLPVLRLGTAYGRAFGSWMLTGALDVDLSFDGRLTYAWHTGPVAYHPRMGMEVRYRQVIALRGGLRQWISGPEGFSVSPSVGAGIHVRAFIIDYSFGHFAGLASELGNAHRLSVRVRLPASSSK